MWKRQADDLEDVGDRVMSDGRLEHSYGFQGNKRRARWRKWEKWDKSSPKGLVYEPEKPAY